MHGLAVGGSAESKIELDSGHCEVGCWFFLKSLLYYDGDDLSIIVLAKLMDRQRNC
jgi:hypothetical protein